MNNNRNNNQLTIGAVVAGFLANAVYDAFKKWSQHSVPPMDNQPNQADKPNDSNMPNVPNKLGNKRSE